MLLKRHDNNIFTHLSINEHIHRRHLGGLIIINSLNYHDIKTVICAIYNRILCIMRQHLKCELISMKFDQKISLGCKITDWWCFLKNFFSLHEWRGENKLILAMINDNTQF